MVHFKEIIKVRGFQVAPAELEGHLLLHPDVADACVVSILDEYSGELPLAYVVVHEKALQRIAGDQVAALKLKAAIAKVGGTPSPPWYFPDIRYV
jgi:acyl-coenzyme A synthetase/AMP-(fatty) acid ligase